MYAAVLRSLGKPPRYDQFPDPVPGEGEVIVQVRAASLKPVDKQLASGSHFASPRELPVVCGTDGLGSLSDGTRVFFGGTRPPYGAMAERTLVRREFCFPVPDNISDETAAALPNPGVSAWVSLVFRAKLVPGESVLILGATGVTGKLAIRIAKLLGAARVVAAGRNQQVLSTLPELGADAIIWLGTSDNERLCGCHRLFRLPGCPRLLVGSTGGSIVIRDDPQRIRRRRVRDSVGASRRKRRTHDFAPSRRLAEQRARNSRYCWNSTS